MQPTPRVSQKTVLAHPSIDTFTYFAIPDELMLYIFSFLPTLFFARLVCKKWQDLAHEEHLGQREVAWLQKAHPLLALDGPLCLKRFAHYVKTAQSHMPKLLTCEQLVHIQQDTCLLKEQDSSRKWIVKGFINALNLNLVGLLADQKLMKFPPYLETPYPEHIFNTALPTKNAWRIIAEAWLLAGRITDAIHIVDQHVEASPALIRHYSSLGQFKSALDVLEKLFSVEVPSGQDLEDSIKFFFEKTYEKNAFEHYESLLDFLPENYLAVFLLPALERWRDLDEKEAGRVAHKYKERFIKNDH